MRRIATFLRQRAQTATLAIALAILLPSRLSAQVPLPPDAAAPAEVGHRIVISLKDRRLYLLEDGREARSFPVAIGRPGVTIPLGDTTVVRKRRNPTWHPTANQRRAKPSLPLAVPPGPSNPLGRHALDLGWTAIAIHGTNEPGSIGRRASGGCFRMLPADVEALFGTVEVGTPVRVVAGEAGLSAPPTIPAKEAGPKTVPSKPGPLKPGPSKPAVIPIAVPAPAVKPAALAAPAAAPAPAAVPPEPIPPTPIAATQTPPKQTPVVPDPRCATASAPLRRMICTVPDLAALDGRARGIQERFLKDLPAERRDVVSYALVQDDRRFDDRIAALCWIRKGTEDDPTVAATARACLRDALSARIEDVTQRVAELGSGAMAAWR